MVAFGSAPQRSYLRVRPMLTTMTMGSLGKRITRVVIHRIVISARGLQWADTIDFG
jgi:predicted Zn-dependent protease with MMP-like domain